MNYIINPSWFYWVNVVDVLRSVMLGMTVFSCGACVFFLIVMIVSCDEEYDYKRSKKCFLIVLPFALLSIACIIFIPSKQTMVEMQVARVATYENAEWTVDAIKSAVDYIIQAIKGIK